MNIQNLLKLFQFFCVIMMPIIALRYYFKNWTVLSFADGIINYFTNFFSSITTLNVNGVDFTILFLMLPWVVFIVLSSAIINQINFAHKKLEELQLEFQKQGLHIKEEQHKQEHNEQLMNKKSVYLVIALVFSKFTLSALPDDEVFKMKSTIKQDIIKTLAASQGKLLEEEFDDDFTFATTFFSQDAAINFASDTIDLMSSLDENIQKYGFSLACRVVLDIREIKSNQFNVLAFLEKAIRAVDLNEICTTKDFSDKYKMVGKMKNINFTSKGMYSINKATVELSKLIINKK